eukprot:ctg_1835.g529
MTVSEAGGRRLGWTERLVGDPLGDYRTRADTRNRVRPHEGVRDKLAYKGTLREATSGGVAGIDTGAPHGRVAATRGWGGSGAWITATATPNCHRSLYFLGVSSALPAPFPIRRNSIDRPLRCPPALSRFAARPPSDIRRCRPGKRDKATPPTMQRPLHVCYPTGFVISVIQSSRCPVRSRRARPHPPGGVPCSHETAGAAARPHPRGHQRAGGVQCGGRRAHRLRVHPPGADAPQRLLRRARLPLPQGAPLRRPADTRRGAGAGGVRAAGGARRAARGRRSRQRMPSSHADGAGGARPRLSWPGMGADRRRQAAGEAGAPPSTGDQASVPLDRLALLANAPDRPVQTHVGGCAPHPAAVHHRRCHCRRRARRGRCGGGVDRAGALVSALRAGHHLQCRQAVRRCQLRGRQRRRQRLPPPPRLQKTAGPGGQHAGAGMG